MNIDLRFHNLEIQGQTVPLFFGAMHLNQFCEEKGITLGEWQDKVGNIDFLNVSSLKGDDTFFLCDMIHTAMSLGHELDTGEKFPHSNLQIRALLMQEQEVFGEALIAMLNSWPKGEAKAEKKTNPKLKKAG